ncbi:hypothetical protein BDZ45DRAFT_752469 [Acephala macrosclerotiorum]|nr:hypothetical protein BDZ45DRAFT_752469 [Acephala macrosclerotiorum]
MQPRNSERTSSIWTKSPLQRIFSITTIPPPRSPISITTISITSASTDRTNNLKPQRDQDRIMERTNIKQASMEDGQMPVEHSPKSAAEITPAKSNDAPTVTTAPTTYPSVASMYQRAAYKTLAQLRIRNRKGVLLNRRTAHGLRQTWEVDGEVTLDSLGIKTSYAPVTWREQTLREGGKIKNYCYMESRLRWSWTISEGVKENDK